MHIALIILLRKKTRQSGKNSAVMTHLPQMEALTRGMKYVHEACGKEAL
jgi:NAD-dependent oxidoreductase involved in siderophore biosynthesis